MHPDNVEQYFGAPIVGATERDRMGAIWKYGDIEFHCQENAVDLIFTDWFTRRVGKAHVPSGAANIDLDPWIITDRLANAEAVRALEKIGIPFQKKDFPYAENGIDLITDAGVRLSFNNENNSSEVEATGEPKGKHSKITLSSVCMSACDF